MLFLKIAQTFCLDSTAKDNQLCLYDKYSPNQVIKISVVSFQQHLAYCKLLFAAHLNSLKVCFFAAMS